MTVGACHGIATTLALGYDLNVTTIYIMSVVGDGKPASPTMDINKEKSEEYVHAHMPHTHTHTNMNIDGPYICIRIQSLHSNPFASIFTFV